MIRFPHCKINLGLHILEKLPDGYHRIETLFYPVPLTDILEIIPSTSGQTTLAVTGIELPGKAEDNICFKAWQLLHQDFNIPTVDIYLHKLIPTGAGLGGGSSDASMTLLMLDELFSLSLTEMQLHTYALRLGMDCPFFLQNQPAIGSNKGEVLTPHSLDLKGKYLVLVKPDIHVSTADAYSGVKPLQHPYNIANLIARPLNDWKSILVNDFEPSVFIKYPMIGEVKDQLYSAGALYASMSGSGSAVFAIFNEVPKIDEMFGNCFVWKAVME
ncbi:MAG: 4-(cytidine 5'-diphospho)-2-C-methyl-D-erythritol kinase [Bacteroidales bacterium]|nr:4-(cytidine 5'-diphospho)-2-C-methyl-D-erythritol kinase [Bacteroidales bacterium]